MTPTLDGIHHVTAIAGDPQANFDFYANVLSLRLIKRTINFDDPGTFHLYYGDGVGSPGTILTFFPWPGAARGRVGAGIGPCPERSAQFSGLLAGALGRPRCAVF